MIHLVVSVDVFRIIFVPRCCGQCPDQVHALTEDLEVHFTEFVWLQKRIDELPPVDSAAPIPPGGPSHHYIRDEFVDPGDGMAIRRMPPDKGGFYRQFIPAFLADNPSMDKDYESRIRGLSDPAMVSGGLRGDWSVVSGSYYADVFDARLHVIRPHLLLTDSWKVWRGMDDGKAIVHPLRTFEGTGPQRITIWPAGRYAVHGLKLAAVGGHDKLVPAMETDYFGAEWFRDIKFPDVVGNQEKTRLFHVAGKGKRMLIRHHPSLRRILPTCRG